MIYSQSVWVMSLCNLHNALRNYAVTSSMTVASQCYLVTHRPTCRNIPWKLVGSTGPNAEQTALEIYWQQIKARWSIWTWLFIYKIVIQTVAAHGRGIDEWGEKEDSDKSDNKLKWKSQKEKKQNSDIFKMLKNETKREKKDCCCHCSHLKDSTSDECLGFDDDSLFL